MNKKQVLNPKVKEVLILLGMGAILTASILIPGVAVIMKEYTKYQIAADKKRWEKFNIWRLRQLLRRLEAQKIVEVTNGRVTLTENGRKKFLRYRLEDMLLTGKIDGKWRIVIYDIANLKRSQRDHFRSMLKKLHFLQLQESVYLTPYACEGEIEYLKQLFDIGSEVHVIKVVGLENEDAYRSYFGI